MRQRRRFADIHREAIRSLDELVRTCANIERMFENGSAAVQLAWVLDQQPSAATHAVLESLLDQPLPRDLQVLAATAWDRHLSAMAAVTAAARVTATVCTDGPDAQDDADAELALALRRTDGEMAYQLHQDRQLLTLPVLYGVFRAGDATPRHVSAFLDVTAHLTPMDVLAVDDAVSARATSMTVSGFRRVVRKTTAKLDSRSPQEKAKARRPRIGVRCQPQPDGLITVAATMPAADGVALVTELNRRADTARTPDDPRLHGERQIDVLLAAMCGPSHGETTTTATTTTTTARPSRRVELQVVIDWRSLLGLRDDPAELIGYGSISAADVRAMLTEPGTVLRRLVTDPVTGVLVDYGTTRYRPDAHLSGLTKARDVTCRYPGCARNAIYCDDEHCQPYPTGDTSAANICQLCRTHHRRKTAGRFTYTRPDPNTGKTVWTTPLGFVYVQEPASYDEAGPDPGDTYILDHVEADQRWIPPLPNRDP
jgi:hypothetical protein